MNSSILVVDDEEPARYLLMRHLNAAGYEVQQAENLMQARKAVAKKRFDAVLLDLKLPDGNGLDWLAELQETLPSATVVIVTASVDIPLAVEAMRRGAENFLTKPIDINSLEMFLRRSIETTRTRKRDSAQRRLTPENDLFFGDSSLMQHVHELAKLAAESQAPVILHGETGTGKGMLARWIHEHSDRSMMPCVEVNCSILRGDLLASELFGHTRGAFTSAVDHKQGLLDIADGGTLFLDEIGDMEPQVQSQFLKAIEEKRYRRLGEVHERRSEFRLICATTRDLLQDSNEGRFRKDLYYRIRVLPIELPPLRDRISDLLPLVKYLLTKLGSPENTVHPEAMSLLKKYSWPGNIRELRNILERAILLSRGKSLNVSHFSGLEAPDPLFAIDEIQQRSDRAEVDVHEVLKRFRNDKAQAARYLGISRATLYRKLKNRT